MRVIISQLRKGDTNPHLPLMIHNAYEVETHAGEMFTSEPGYEISAVFITQTPTPLVIDVPKVDPWRTRELYQNSSGQETTEVNP